MIYEVRHVGKSEFEAEAIGEDGLARTVLFSGPDSKRRAETYAFQQNDEPEEL